MLTESKPAGAGLKLIFALAFITVMLALIFFDPFGPANVWIVLAISFGVAGLALRNRLRNSDEVMSAATRTSFAIGAPLAVVVSIVTVVFASRIESFRDFLLYNWPETTNDPRMVGFAIGVMFTTAATWLCVCIARAGWWLTKK